LKFGDMVIAVASIAVLLVLFEYPLGFVLDPQTTWGSWANSIISLILGALIIGYIFRSKIWEENQIRTILKIVVLGAVLIIFSTAIHLSNSDFGAAVKEAFPTFNGKSTATYTASDWFTLITMVMLANLFLQVVLVLVVGFVGLYVGSMIRKPKKS
jgi:uncharacterized protein (UPF0333 family)